MQIEAQAILSGEGPLRERREKEFVDHAVAGGSNESRASCGEMF